MDQVQCGTDILQRFQLRNRTALITGARREIGRAVALAFAAQGATLAAHHVGSDEEREDAQAVVDAILKAGGRATPHAADFASQGAGKRLAEDAVRTYGAIDILVLNASIEIPEAYTEISSETFDRQIAINLRSALELIQALVPPMVDRGWGRVLSIGSVQQALPHPAMLVYASTKVAQYNWMRNLARQLSSHGVTFNNLAPGSRWSASATSAASQASRAASRCSSPPKTCPWRHSKAPQS